jgi:hypothetical protein
MTLLDGQYQFNGLTLGVGTHYGIRRIEGLEDVSARTNDKELPRGHGSVPGPHYVAAKDPVVDLVIRANGNPVALAERLDRLRRAFDITDGTPRPLAWKRPGHPVRRVLVSPVLVQHAEEFETVDRVAFPRIALTAADPRIYSEEAHTLTISTFDPAGSGDDYHGEYPKDFPDTVGGEGVAFNAGSSNAYPLLRFYGPNAGTITTVTLRNLTTGQSLNVVTDIGPGQILTVDNLAHVTGAGTQVVGLNGVNRYGDWQQPRVPFVLPPGDSIVRYEADATTDCVLLWRDTWM